MIDCDPSPIRARARGPSPGGAHGRDGRRAGVQLRGALTPPSWRATGSPRGGPVIITAVFVMAGLAAPLPWGCSRTAWTPASARPDLRGRAGGVPAHAWQSYAVLLVGPDHQACAILLQPGDQPDRRAACPADPRWRGGWKQSGVQVGLLVAGLSSRGRRIRLAGHRAVACAAVRSLLVTGKHPPGCSAAPASTPTTPPAPTVAGPGQEIPGTRPWEIPGPRAVGAGGHGGSAAAWSGALPPAWLLTLTSFLNAVGTQA
ncbi:hypothetical protein QJS66_15710 [Kocuria rhizophila]|nr:hypothetical protein QJS66_15710 [Kocuria rhizophila]